MGFFSRLFNLDKLEASASTSVPATEPAATDVGFSRSEAEAVLAEIDIDSAIAAHDNWKNRLQQVLDGQGSEKLDPATVCLDDRCELGRWLHGAGGQRLGKYPAFQVLIARHKYFHEQAATVLTQVQSGAAEDARKTLGSSYKYASNQVILLLKELKRGLGQGA